MKVRRLMFVFFVYVVLLTKLSYAGLFGSVGLNKGDIFQSLDKDGGAIIKIISSTEMEVEQIRVSLFDRSSTTVVCNYSVDGEIV
ncbi:MAG: hypothetical protein L3V56_14745 [Candidatus Magnetoovum sp. WYHC-5]|nr:hypothetical protein [Candidatus Magnetoovum sp. WYHC-5]